MDFQLYNPYDNYVVASSYVELICQCLKELGVNITKIDSIKDGKGKGIVVVTARDAIKAKKKGYYPIITWIQGIIPEESFLRNHSIIRKELLSFQEKKGLFSSDVCIFVSDAMRMHYLKKYGFVSKYYYIMPCFNDEIHRESFFVENKYSCNKFIYAGGLQDWQCFNETVRLYSIIESKCEDTHFRVLTKEKQTAEKILIDYGVKNYSLGCVPQEQMPRELATCKFGFCLRKADPVNSVSTPTKLSNYVSRGVIPIITNAVHDFYEKARKSDYCICVNLDQLNESAERIIDFCKKETTPEEVYKSFDKYFGDYYSRAFHKQELTAIFREVLTINE